MEGLFYQFVQKLWELGEVKYVEFVYGSGKRKSNLQKFILSMDNNNDNFLPSNNKPCLEMRDLLELLKDKQQSYYYEHILLPSGKILGDFIA